MAEPGKKKVAKKRALATTELDSSDDVRIPDPKRADREPDEREESLVGKVLSGLYKVEVQIGEGGMGTVYRAEHIHLSKSFAIKVLSKKIAQNHSAVERLRQEAVAASRIDHEHICQVVNFDKTDDGDVFIVMELLEGRGLADLLERGRLSIPKSLEIAMQICRALQAAHEQDIVHRDLKPENIFIVRKGDRDFVKVLDFGISKVKSAEAEQVRMTKTGQLVGTPLYMSPEQAKGETDIDRRADVYALGVLLYEMLTGSPPFEGGNYFQLLWKHGNEAPVAPREHSPEAAIPQALEDVVLKALAKAPEDRYQSMAELEQALAAAVPDLEATPHIISLTPSTPRLAKPARHSTEIRLPTKRTPPWMFAAIGVVVTGLVIGIVFAASDTPEQRETPPLPEAPIDRSPVEPEPTETEPELPEELPRGVEPPATHDVRFESHPPGAEVVLDGEVLGRTPLVAPLPASETALEVTFRLPRHEEERVSVVPSDGAEVEARLRRIRPTGVPDPGIKMTF